MNMGGKERKSYRDRGVENQEGGWKEESNDDRIDKRKGWESNKRKGRERSKDTKGLKD
jgi:hypothetical protein